MVRMDAALYVLMCRNVVVSLSKKDVLCVTMVVQLFIHFCLNILKLKYKCYWCFYGNQLLKSSGTSKFKFSYFKKNAPVFDRSKTARNVAEILKTSIKSGQYRHLKITL